MANGIPKGLDGLSREGATRSIGDRDREDDRPAHPASFKDLLAGEDRRLEIQRVENRLEQEEINPTIEQGLDLLGIGNHQPVEGHGTVAGIIHIRRHRGGTIGGTDRSRDKHLAPRILRHEFIGRLTSHLGTGDVDLPHGILQAVVGLRDSRRAEGIRLDDVAPPLEVGAMDPLDHVRTSNREEIIVSLQVMPMILEAFAAEVRLGQWVTLDHRSHRSVEQGDATGEKLSQEGV